MAIIELDQAIKQAVQTWREKNYQGASQITRRLLHFWFKEEQILPDGSRFEFWRCQREGIEALIYSYEVCKYQSLYELARGFGVSIPGGLTRAVPDLARLDIARLPSRLFRLSEIELPEVRYRERDLLEHKIVREKILAFDYTENFSLYLSYVCKAITSKTGTSSIFVELVPKVKTYIEKYLFDQKVDGENLDVTKKLNYIPIREKLVEIFSEKINSLSKKEEKVSIPRYFKVSETQPLHTSEPITSVRP